MSKDKRPINYLHWNITRACNYNCSYCSSRGRKIDPNVPLPYSFLDGFSKHLEGKWQIQFSGSGEPFLTPDFLKVTRELIKMGHQVGVLTNFSAPLDKIREFCEITKGNLFEMGASLHLEHISPDKFLKKALTVQKVAGDIFSVRCVAQKGHLEEIKEISQMFRNKGLPFSMQLQRDHSSKKDKKEESFVDYSKKEMEIIRNIGKSIYNKNKLRFKGKMCWAGSKYFSINEDGNAWRCHPARRYRVSKSNEGYLGNLPEGTFQLRKKPLPCPYKYCYCLAAVINNMIVE